MHQMRLLSASLVLAFGLSACGGSDGPSAPAVPVASASSGGARSNHSSGPSQSAARSPLWLERSAVVGSSLPKATLAIAAAA